MRSAVLPVVVVAVAACAPSPEPRLAWSPCGEFQCATITVPIDYADPGGPVFTLPLIKAPATGARTGTLVAAAGGPGQSGVAMIRDSVADWPAALRERFDIVSFDPRGVGGSVPRISCPIEGEPTAEAPDLELVGDAVPSSKQFAEACLRGTGEHVLRNVGTANVIRDLDTIRAATGQDRLTFLGFSYGTRIGQLYADRYPDKIRAMVLDGVDNVFLDWRDDIVQQAEGAEDALRAYARECPDRTDTCPATTEADIIHEINTALAHADTTDTGDDLRAELSAKLPFPSEWPDIAALLATADPTTETPTDEAPTTETPSEEAPTVEDAEGDALSVISCMDRRHPTDLAAYEEAEAAVQRVSRVGSAEGALPCAFLPTSPITPTVVRAEGAPPILLVGTTVDAATPYRWAESLATAMPSALLLTNEDVGHAVYGGISPCVDAAVTAYLLDLTPPAPRCTP